MALLRVPEKTAGMKVPEYQRQIFYTAGTGRRARADDAFARRTGEAEKEKWKAAGHFVAQLGATAEQSPEDYEDFQAAKAAGAYNAFQISMKEKLYGEKGILQRQGEEAFGSFADADKAVRESMEEAAEAAGLGEHSRALLAKQVFAYHAWLMPEARRHAETQRSLWLDSQNQTGMELAREGFLYGGDLQSRMMYLNDMQENHRRMAKRHGLDDKEEAADWEKLRSALYDELEELKLQH